MSELTKRKKGEPSKKIKRARLRLSVMINLHEKGVKADLKNHGKGFKKPGSMKMRRN